MLGGPGAMAGSLSVGVPVVLSGVVVLAVIACGSSSAGSESGSGSSESGMDRGGALASGVSEVEQPAIKAAQASHVATQDRSDLTTSAPLPAC